MASSGSIPFLRRCHSSRCFGIIALFTIALFTGSLSVQAAPIPSDKPAAYPGWWFTREVITPKDDNPTPMWNYGWGDYPAPDDFVVINVGQLKQMATQAAAEMNAKLPGGGAGTDINNLVAEWNSPPAVGVVRDDYAALNLGQLKAVATLFYNRLVAVHHTDSIPWAGAVLAADDYSVANLGQLKALFSFDVSYCSTSTGIPDWWALLCYGTTAINPGDPDGLGDNLNIQQAFQAGLTPDFYHGNLPVITNVSGGGQSVDLGTTLPQAVTFQVTDATGNPIANAPVTLSIDAGLISLSGDPAAASTQIRANTDANGNVTVTVFAPSYNTSFEITATATSGGQTASAIAAGAASDLFGDANKTPPPQDADSYPQPSPKKQIASVSKAIYSLHQYTTTPNPIKWYKKETWVFTEDINGTDTNGNPSTATGTYNSVITVDMKTGIWTYTGDSQSERHYTSDSGAKVKVVITSTQSSDGSWHGTETDTYTTSSGTTTNPPVAVSVPAMPAAGNLTNATPTVVTISGSGISGTKTLSEEYKAEDFIKDTAPNMSPYSDWSTTYEGYFLAKQNVLMDGWYNASCYLQNANYKWVLDNSFPAPNPTFSWYEVFIPSDSQAAWIPKQKSWSNAGASKESPVYTLDATQLPGGQQANGSWILVRLSVGEASKYPLCSWRDVVGAGETVSLSLVGCPDPDGTLDPTWTVSPGNMGSPPPIGKSQRFDFTAGAKAGKVTITATVNGTAFSTDLTIKIPERITQVKDHEKTFLKGTGGAGMYLVTTIQPTDVSFSGLQISEGRADPLPGGPVHNPAGDSMMGLKVAANARAWVGVWSDNRDKTYDRVSVGPIYHSNSMQPPPYPLPAGWPPSFTWNIPWYFKLISDKNGTGTKFSTVPTTISFDSNTGFADVTKSGEEAKRSPNQ
jgi:hypothetical protein